MDNFITQEEIEAALQFIRQVLPYYETDFAEEYYELNEEFDDYFKAGWRVEAGASKLVFLPPVGNYVIKVPFQGCKDERWDDDLEDYEWGYLPFEGAAYGGWDYCNVEQVLFKEALTVHLDKFFAETFQIGEENGHPVYVQERCERVGAAGASCSLDENNSTKKIYGVTVTCAMPVEFATECRLLGISLDEMKHLANFIEDFEISDLHCANWGMLNNRPVLLDYSSFHN